MKYIIFGLGNFGCALGNSLTAMGHEVLGVDKDLSKVEALKDKLTHTISLDSTDLMAVKGLPIKDADAVIVAIGEDDGASIMTTAVIKQLEAKRIISRVMSPLQKMVVEAMGVTEFVDPESEAAEKMALTLDMKNVIDSFRVSDQYRIMELTLPERYIGNQLTEVDFSSKYKVTLITVIRNEISKSLLGNARKTSKVMGVLPSDFQFEKDDVLVLFGDLKDIERLMR